MFFADRYGPRVPTNPKIKKSVSPATARKVTVTVLLPAIDDGAAGRRGRLALVVGAATSEGFRMRNESAGPGVARRGRMVELGRNEALALLATAPIGRVVFSQRALPAVRPVNFAVFGGDVVFRVRGDSRFAGALDGNVVAFEADQIDPARRAGWSVVATGLAQLLESGAEFERLLEVAPVPWAPGDHNRVVRIRVELVTGRRIAR